MLLYRNSEAAIPERRNDQRKRYAVFGSDVRLRVVDGTGQTQAIDFKIDTGFTDFISLPSATVISLGLPRTSYQTVQLADGNVVRVAVQQLLNQPLKRLSQCRVGGVAETQVEFS